MQKKEEQIDQFCDKIVIALGSRELRALSYQSSLQLEQRLISLLCLHQGNIASISLKEIQMEYLRVKDQNSDGAQVKWDSSENVTDY